MINQVFFKAFSNMYLTNFTFSPFCLNGIAQNYPAFHCVFDK